MEFVPFGNVTNGDHKTKVEEIPPNIVYSGSEGNEFLARLITWSESVGIIEALNGRGMHYSATVFRLGDRYVMTCAHVVKGISRK